MLKRVSLFFGVLLLSQTVFTQTKQADSMTLLNGHFSAGVYAAGSVSRSDLAKILHAGVRAPSAGNRQPWRFIVSQDVDYMKHINLARPERGNAIIVVVTQNDSSQKVNDTAMFDLGCASQAMYLAAQALGYGSRIYIGQTEIINREKDYLKIAENETAVVLIRIGRLPSNVDAASSASPRKNDSDVITYMK